MSYGIGIYDSKGMLALTDGWYPMAYKGTMSFRVASPSAPDVSQGFSIPAGCVLVVQPAGAAVQHIAHAGSFSGYVVGSYVSGGTVTLRQHLWYGYADSPLNGTIVNFNVFAYYPTGGNVSGYGAFFAGSGVSVALTNTTRLHVLRYKWESYTSSGDFNVPTGVSTGEPAPSVYVSDTGYNAIASYVFASGGYWYVKVLRAGGRFLVDYTYTSEAPRAGLVRVAVFGNPPPGLPEYGLALFGSDGGVAFRSDYRPEMPRGLLASPSPSVSVPPGGGWQAIGDGNPQYIPGFGSIRPMIKARMIGISKLSFLPFPVATWVNSSGVLTCGVLNKGGGSLPVGAAFGYWGENSGNSPIMYINELDYF